jgi:hypothetical protein
VSGIVRSAITPTGERWENGIAWRPERCVTARGFDPCGPDFEDAVGAGGNTITYYRPVAFRVEDECTTRGLIDEGRVRRQAVAVTSYMVARELHGGGLSLDNPYGTPDSGGVANQVNAYLAEGGTTVAGTWAPQAGLGALEEATRDAILGQDVFIHMPVSLVPLMGDAIIREGQLLRTRTGAVVVADAGYPGSGPVTAGTAEVQTVTITGAPTGGNFTLTFDGETTIDIGYNSPALDVQGALNSLPNLNGVTVTGADGGPYTVTFPANDGDVPQMTGDGSDLTGGTAPAVAVATTTPGVEPGPEAGVWMYATGPVQVRLGEVMVNRINDHRSNRVLMTADRLFAATFDPCTLHSIQIDDPTPV